MSAYILINTQAQAVSLKNKKGKKKTRSSKDGASASGSGSRSRGSTAGTMMSLSSNSSTRGGAGGSAGSISSASHKPSVSAPKKKVFDTNKNIYVESSETALERAILDYEQDLQRITDFHYNVLNQRINLQYLKDSLDNSNFLFSKKNINMIRFIFFEDFSTDQNLIEIKIAAGNLSFIKRIEEFQTKTRTHTVINGLPGLEIGQDSDDENDLRGPSYCHEVNNPTSGSINSYPDPDYTDTIDSIYADYSSQASPIKPQQEVVSIRSLFEGKSFWNNVYQDMKFDYLESYKFLPLVNQLEEFYIEVIEQFLYNIRTLEIEMNEDLQNDAKVAGKYTFFYLRDQNYEWFKLMSNVHSKFYRFPDLMSESDKYIEEIKLVRSLSIVMTSNIELSFKTGVVITNPILRVQFEKTINLWKEFTRFIFEEIICKKENFLTKSLTAPPPPPPLPLEPSQESIATIITSSNITFNNGYTGSRMPSTVGYNESATVELQQRSKSFPNNLPISFSDKEMPPIPTFDPRKFSVVSAQSSNISVMSPARNYGSTSTGLSTPISEAEELFYGGPKQAKQVSETASFATTKKRGGFFDKFKKRSS